ncbi:MAG: efflux RND transporter permease subunit [Deferribacteres bacterium]|nr:efflux RND transporter permease subunit [Deferribacteres bacterium]
MKSIVNYFIKYHISADLLIMLIAVLGLMSLSTMTTSRFPEIKTDKITIETVMPGASPQEMENGITLKIENELQGITGIKKITSQSKENLSLVSVTLENSADANKALRDIKNAVDGITTFPVDAEKPVTSLKELKDMAATLALYGDVSHSQLKSLAEFIKQDLLAKPEIADVSLVGARNPEIEIALSQTSLQRHNLTFSQVAQAIANKNTNLTAGTIEAANQELTIRAAGKHFFARELQEIVVKNTPSGGPIYLRDIAVLSDGWQDGAADIYFNGTPAININVMTTTQLDISKGAAKAIAYMQVFNAQQKNVQLALVMDGSIVVQQRADLLLENGLLGMVLVMLVLGFFLNIRLAFWVALSIPISMLGMFVLAPYWGVNINMFSLFGLILAIGILVDDGIVISENIFKKYENGMSASLAAWEGLREVSTSVIVAVVTTCIFFSVFFFMEGTIGGFVAHVGFTVVVTLLVSLVEAFLILPAHIAHSKALSRGRQPNRVERLANRIFSFLKSRWYEPALRFCLNRRWIAIGLFTGLFMGAIGLLASGWLPFTFFPIVDEDAQIIKIELPAGTTKEKTKELITQIEQVTHVVNDEYKAQRADGKDVILHHVTQVGPEENKATLTLYLLDGETRNLESFRIANAIQNKCDFLSETESTAFGNPSFFGSAISISLMGHDFAELVEAAQKITRSLTKKFPELKNITDSNEISGREFHIELTPQAKAIGLSLREVTQELRYGILGYEVQTLQRGLDEVRVNVRYDSDDIDSYSDLENLKIRLGNNEYRLKSIANLVPVRSTRIIHHENGMPVITVTADQVDPYASTTVMQSQVEIEVLSEMRQRYPNIRFTFGGQSESAMETVASAQAAVPVVLLLIFISIVINFRSFKQAIVVLLLIPFAFIGIALGHIIHGISLSILSLYGIIAVAGIIINDSLVFVSRMNDVLQQGAPFVEAVFEAGLSRFRAIVLTSITTIAGLAPLIFETSLQAKLMVPMAISLAYGLAAATFITLLLLPALLKLQNSFSKWLHWLWEGETISDELVEPAVIELNRLRTEATQSK